MNCQQCTKEAVWIDNGLRLQWWYCRDCKVEVVAQPAAKVSPEDLFDSGRDQSTHLFNPITLNYDVACFYCTASQGDTHRKDCARPKAKVGKSWTGMSLGTNGQTLTDGWIDLFGLWGSGPPGETL